MNPKKIRFMPDPATGRLSEEDTKSYFSRIGFAVGLLCIVSTLVSTLLYLLTSSLLPSLGGGALGTLVSHTVSMVSIYAIAMPLFVYLLKPLPEVKPYRERMPLGDVVGGFCLTILAMTVGNYIGNIILIYVEQLLNTTTQNPIAEVIAPTDGATVAVTVVFMVILAPILEELVFRKLLCNKLLPLGEGYAILLSAAVFALFHGNLYQIPYAFTVGLVLGLVYVKTGKLIYTVIYHALMNLLGSVVGPWILERIDLERVNAIIESGSLDPNDPILEQLALLGFYEMAMLAAAIAGLVLLFKARKKRSITLEKGILPPPAKGRVANLFCNAGVALAVTCFTVLIVLSLA